MNSLIPAVKNTSPRLAKHIVSLRNRIKQVGYHPGMDFHEKRKLGMFNLLNLTFGMTLGIVIPLVAHSGGTKLSPAYWLLLSGSPVFITLITAFLNSLRGYETSRTLFFILHPFLLTSIYFLKIDIGTDLFFICFGVLSVFFLQNMQTIIFSFSFSMTCYFLSMGLVKESGYRLESTHLDFYLLNRVIAIFFIFYGIFIIRNENGRFQLQILEKNQELQNRSLQMQTQARQLSELNSLKNKLFSVIAHDLRGPLYAMHRLFKNMIQLDLPAEEIKLYMPEISRDLGDTTGHIENLLQWTKSQMLAEAIEPQVVDLSTLLREVLSFLRLQVEAKKLRVENRLEDPVYVRADREMINLVLRNLLSNAIKFTPENGTITLGAVEKITDVEVFVQDSGTGMSADKLKELENKIYHSTMGTTGEAGTGLGLMLVKEFLDRNGSRLQVSSQLGMGSTFSFTLPKYTKTSNPPNRH